MKKEDLKSLELNKKSISTLSHSKIKGGENIGAEISGSEVGSCTPECDTLSTGNKDCD